MDKTKKMNIVNKNNKNITVSGAVLLSTIDTMESFGNIGREVLAEFGIAEIDEKKQYPFEVRSAMHKAALDRFGEKAILAFGFNHGERMFEIILPNAVERIKKLKVIMRKNANDNLLSPLNDFMSYLVSYFNKNISGATQGVKEVEYGFFCTEKKDGIFHLKGVMAAELYQEAFIRGVVLYMLTKLLSKYFDFVLLPDKEKNITGFGFSEFHMVAKFKKNISKASEVELLWRKKMEIREELTQQVLKNSDQQNETLKSLSKKLGKYLPPQIHEALIKGNYDTGIATRRKKLTIFFSDIANFTSTSEGLQPEDLTKYLNEYFSEMTTIALDSGATIDKYIGDAMMVFFGDPETRGEKNDARACVEMALRMQEKMKELQMKWSKEGFADPFRVRMGINTGYCNVGNFGSDQRLTYTIIGGEVNVAQRLEVGADANGILLSYESYAHAQDMVQVEERDVIKMKGISREIKVFSVYGRKANDLKKAKKIDLNINESKKTFDKVEKQLTLIPARVDKLERQLSILSDKIDQFINTTKD